MSDTSETVSLSKFRCWTGNFSNGPKFCVFSLASHVRRVRVPSQSSDVDQYLDDLFMPVLDGNIDEFSDARSLAASIKGCGRTENVADFVDGLISNVAMDQDLVGADEAISLAASIQGGGKGLKDPGSQNYSSPSREPPYQPIGLNVLGSTPQQSLGLISPSPLLMPGFFGGRARRPNIILN